MKLVCPTSSSENEYNAAYKAGVEYLEPLEPTRHLIEFLSRYPMRRNSRVLDFGCGEGRDTLFLAKRGFRTIGLDSSPSAIRKARLRALRQKLKARFLVADMTRRTTFRGDQFDLAINIDNIHGLYKKSWRLSHFREAHRILRKGSFYFLCAHTARVAKTEIARAGLSTFDMSGEKKSVRMAYEPSFIGTAKGYQDELESSRFEILERKIGRTPPIPALTSTFVARKPNGRSGNPWQS